MFWGCHEHVLDEKGRTSLPKEFRELLTRGSELPWLTLRSRCLAIYPADKFDKIRQRLSERFGYDEKSAEEVLQYVAALFARGDAKRTTPEAA